MGRRKKILNNSSITGGYVKLPYSVVNSDIWSKLSAPGVKLLSDLLTQYNGNNNGMMSPCHTLMKKRGWASSSLYRANSELQHKGFIVVTRQGMKIRGYPTLIAITWMGIDEPIKNKFDECIKPSNIPLNYWSKSKSCWKHKPTIKEVK